MNALTDRIMDSGMVSMMKSADISKKEIAGKNTIENNSIEKNTVQKNTVQKNTASKNTVQKNTVQKNTVSQNTVQKNTVSQNTVQKNTVSKNTVQKNTVPKNTVPKNTVQKIKIQKNVIEKRTAESGVLHTAFIKSLPIFFSYVFVAFSYGLMMQEAGFSWFYSLFTSLTVYTGAFQFVLITFFSSGASLATIAVTAFLMNSRQTFYSITFLNDFKNMGHKKVYMIQTMTDETYAVNCTLEPEEPERHKIMFLVALLSRCYWMFGAVIGGVLGQIIPFELKGIDFCMTALFITIFVDQWEKTKDHRPALTGILVGVICLFLFGKNFMLSALILTSGILLFMRNENTEYTSEKQTSARDSLWQLCKRNKMEKEKSEHYD